MSEQPHRPNRLEHSGGERDNPTSPLPSSRTLDGPFWSSPTEPRRQNVTTPSPLHDTLTASQQEATSTITLDRETPREISTETSPSKTSFIFVSDITTMSLSSTGNTHLAPTQAATKSSHIQLMADNTSTASPTATSFITAPKTQRLKQEHEYNHSTTMIKDTPICLKSNI
jgi:hypothetical protein